MRQLSAAVFFTNFRRRHNDENTPMMEMPRRYGHTVHKNSAYGSPDAANTYGLLAVMQAYSITDAAFYTETVKTVNNKFYTLRTGKERIRFFLPS